MAAFDLASLQADYDSVTALIRRIENSSTQEHWQGGDRHRAPELPKLYERQAYLRQQIQEASTSGGITVSPIRFVNR